MSQQDDEVGRMLDEWWDESTRLGDGVPPARARLAARAVALVQREREVAQIAERGRVRAVVVQFFGRLVPLRSGNALDQFLTMYDKETEALCARAGGRARS